MAQTQRTVAANYVNLADNSAQGIDAEQLRDIIETVRPGHAEIAITATAETSIASANTFVVAAGTYTLTADSYNWDMATSGQLRYTGTEDRAVHIAASFSLTSAGNNKTYRIRCALNGTGLSPSEVKRKIATGADVGSSASHAFTVVSADDYIDVQVANAGDATNCTFETLNLFVMDMPI